MIRLEMKNCNMVLTDKQQKHHHYYHGKLINMNILAGKEILSPGEITVIEQT